MAAALGQTAVFGTAFKIVNGVASPVDEKSLGHFQGLQRALEAARQKFAPSAAPVRADGDIGSTTLNTLRAVVSAAAIQKTGVGSTLLAMGTAPLGSVASNAKQIAGLLAAVASVSVDFTPKPAARPPTAVPISPGQVQPLAPPSSPEAAEGGGIHWAWWVGGVALLGLAGFLGFKFFGGPSEAFAGGENYEEYDYEEAAGDFIDV